MTHPTAAHLSHLETDECTRPCGCGRDARTTTLRGVDAGRYYVEDQLGYYLDRGEPPGVWAGRGVAHLGLAGDVGDEAFLDLMAGMDPRTGELLGTRHTERTVRGYDVTCSAPKSVSVFVRRRRCRPSGAGARRPRRGGRWRRGVDRQPGPLPLPGGR